MTRQLRRLLAEPELVEEYRRRALGRAKEYSWVAVTDRYEKLLDAASAAGGHGPLPGFLVDRDPVSVS